MTIQAIIDLLTEFSERIKNCKAETEEEYQAALIKYRWDIKDRFMELRRQIPELLQINYDEELSDLEVEKLIESIKRNNSKREKMAPLLGTGWGGIYAYHDEIEDTHFYTPVLNDYFPTVIKVGPDKNWDSIIYEILAACPINKIHFTFIDMEMTGKSWIGLNKKFYTDVFNQDQLYNAIKCMKQKIENYLSTGQTPDSYEFVFILSGSHLQNLFSPISHRGSSCGIHIFIACDTGDEWNAYERTMSGFEDGLNRIRLAYLKEYTRRWGFIKDKICSVTPLDTKKKLCKDILNYANAEIEKQQKKQEDTTTAGYMELAKENFKAITSSLDVPVGTSVEKPIYFRQDTISHVHTFIIGQSGTGKSSLLHNIILGATATYAPEDLILYLMDLKIGGVEFNRYRNLKHVRALLVDNTDIQITVEVLRDLQKLLVTRGIQLRESGAVGIDDYNTKNPPHRMPQVLFIADECHEMFNARAGRNTKIYSEMASIIEKIAKEGRSQGVHLVLATQTLAGAEISSSIISNITDYYIFKCSVADSEKLVRDSSKETSSLVTGQLLYAGMQEREVVSCYYYSDDEKKEILSVSETKTTQHCDNRVCYFSGTQIFPLSISECKAANALLEKNPP